MSQTPFFIDLTLSSPLKETHKEINKKPFKAIITDLRAPKIASLKPTLNTTRPTLNTTRPTLNTTKPTLNESNNIYWKPTSNQSNNPTPSMANTNQSNNHLKPAFDPSKHSLSTQETLLINKPTPYQYKHTPSINKPTPNPPNSTAPTNNNKSKPIAPIPPKKIVSAQTYYSNEMREKVKWDRSLYPTRKDFTAFIKSSWLKLDEKSKRVYSDKRQRDSDAYNVALQKYGVLVKEYAVSLDQFNDDVAIELTEHDEFVIEHVLKRTFTSAFHGDSTCSVSRLKYDHLYQKVFEVKHVLKADFQNKGIEEKRFLVS